MIHVPNGWFDDNDDVIAFGGCFDCGLESRFKAEICSKLTKFFLLSLKMNSV